MRGCLSCTRLARNAPSFTLALMLTLSPAPRSSQLIRSDFLGFNHSMHTVRAVIVTRCVVPRYWMKALLVIWMSTMISVPLLRLMVPVMEMTVGFFFGPCFATSMEWLEPAASTGEAMSIAANTTIATIVNFLVKSHHPFSLILFPLFYSHSYGRERLLSPVSTLVTVGKSLWTQHAKALL